MNCEHCNRPLTFVPGSECIGGEPVWRHPDPLCPPKEAQFYAEVGPVFELLGQLFPARFIR